MMTNQEVRNEILYRVRVLDEKSAKRKKTLCTVLPSTAFLCAIIASGFMFQKSITSTPSHTGDISNSTLPHISSVEESNVILWNNTDIETARLAGDFKLVPKQEWVSVFPIDLPANLEWNYYLVYEITKENTVSEKIMCGYVQSKDSQKEQISIYINAKGKPENSIGVYECFGNSMFKESTINNNKVILGVEGTNRWAAFEMKGYIFFVEMFDLSESTSLDIIEGLLN